MSGPNFDTTMQQMQQLTELHSSITSGMDPHSQHMMSGMFMNMAAGLMSKHFRPQQESGGPPAYQSAPPSPSSESARDVETPATEEASPVDATRQAQPQGDLHEMLDNLMGRMEALQGKMQSHMQGMASGNFREMSPQMGFGNELADLMGAMNQMHGHMGNVMGSQGMPFAPTPFGGNFDGVGGKMAKMANMMGNLTGMMGGMTNMLMNAHGMAQMAHNMLHGGAFMPPGMDMGGFGGGFGMGNNLPGGMLGNMLNNMMNGGAGGMMGAGAMGNAMGGTGNMWNTVGQTGQAMNQQLQMQSVMTNMNNQFNWINNALQSIQTAAKDAASGSKLQ